MKHIIMIITIALSAVFSTSALAGKGQGGPEQGMEHRSEQGQMHQKAMEQHQKGTALQKEKMKAKQSEGQDKQAMEMDQDMEQTGVTE